MKYYEEIKNQLIENEINRKVKNYAINKSDLGINPINEGTQIRLIIPVLTEERRKEIVKQAKKYGEECKVAVRNIRRDYIDFIKESDDMSEDYQKLVLDDIQKITDESIKSMDGVVGDKEKESHTISYRLFGQKDTTTLSQEEFVKVLLDEIENKTIR